MTNLNEIFTPHFFDMLIVAGPIFALVIYGMLTGKYPPESKE